jgi:hypothetical protein
MNKTIAIIGGVIAVILVAGIIVYAVKSNPSSPAIVVQTPTPSTPSTPSPSTPSSPKSGAPTAVTRTVVSATDTTAIVSGTVRPNGVFTNYWYEYGIGNSLGTSTSKQNIGSGYAENNAPGYITGLTKDTTYYFRVVAENQYGRVTGATYSFQTTHGNQPPVGGLPGAKTITPTTITRVSADLRGEVTPNRSNTFYWFEYGTTQNLGSTTAGANAGSGTDRISVKISVAGLEPLTTYYVRLNTQNSFGTINSGIISFKTEGPRSATAPSTTTENANNIKDTAATVRGTINPNGAPTTYWFEYGTNNAVGGLLTNATERVELPTGTDPRSVSANLSKLVSNTSYYFQLVAQNDLGITRGERLILKTK